MIMNDGASIMEGYSNLLAELYIQAVANRLELKLESYGPYDMAHTFNARHKFYLTPIFLKPISNDT